MTTTTTTQIQVPKHGTADGELLRVENLKMHFPITTGAMFRRKVGWVRARKLPVPGGHWALWAEGAELQRLARLRGYARKRRDEPIPAELTTPKARNKK